VLTAELLTITPDPTSGGEPARELGRFLDARGVSVRASHVLVGDEPVLGPILARALAGGGLVVCLGEAGSAETLPQLVARALGARLVLSDRVLEALGAAYAARGRAMPRRAEGLALVPQGATILGGGDGGAPGLLVPADGASLVLLPAVPSRAIVLLAAEVLPRLTREEDAPAPVVRRLRLVGIGLAEVQGALTDVLRETEGIAGSAGEAAGEVTVRLRFEGSMPGEAAARWTALEPALRAAFAEAWYGSDDDTLEAVTGRLLRARGLTVAVAESCTGGLVGHRLTQVPGSSTYFERGFVVYSNAAKQALLGVPDAILAKHGAVSAECAQAMAAGARARAGTDLGVSITGIAGPDGGTPTKPVGLVFVGLADARTAASHRYLFEEDRAGNKAWSATMALDRLRRYCLGAT
jgi:nicotinamide-nucleotide amidase